jgi:hypothetical protein
MSRIVAVSLRETGRRTASGGRKPPDETVGHAVYQGAYAPRSPDFISRSEMSTLLPSSRATPSRRVAQSPAISRRPGKSFPPLFVDTSACERTMKLGWAVLLGARRLSWAFWLLVEPVGGRSAAGRQPNAHVFRIVSIVRICAVSAERTEGSRAGQLFACGRRPLKEAHGTEEMAQ